MVLKNIIENTEQIEIKKELKILKILKNYVYFTCAMLHVFLSLIFIIMLLVHYDKSKFFIIYFNLHDIVFEKMNNMYMYSFELLKIFKLYQIKFILYSMTIIKNLFEIIH